MAMGEYVPIRSQFDVQQRSSSDERGSPNLWAYAFFPFTAYLLGALMTRTPFSLQKTRHGLAPPPSPYDHIVIFVGLVTINVPTSIAAAQLAPPTVVWTSPTCQDASVQTQDTSVDEAQHVSAPALSSQPAHETVPRCGALALSSQLIQERVPHHEIEEVEAQAKTEAHGTDCALEANVDCFTNLRRSHSLRAVVVRAINGLFTRASMILDNTFPSTFNNIFEEEKLSNFNRILSRAATMAMGEYVAIRSQLDVKQRSGLNEKSPQTRV
ncbi:hypothetical protein Tco_0652797 [Tanacetum coccineum]|uniref:Uncharacterized protein n=1 Tax=Tanacetum coccineum TaxID=301880 RepID=A0ABQ4WYZ1_9ASTR